MLHRADKSFTLRFLAGMSIVAVGLCSAIPANATGAQQNGAGNGGNTSGGANPGANSTQTAKSNGAGGDSEGTTTAGPRGGNQMSGRVPCKNSMTPANTKC